MKPKESISRGKVTFKDYYQDQVQILPPSLDELIPQSHLVRIVNKVIDQIDFQVLERAYAGGGASNYHPKMMLKVLVYAYCCKVYTSRRIAQALDNNIHFMWLSAMQHPDFRTINNFRSGRLCGLIDDVFGQVLGFLIDQQFVKLESYFVDGTKLRADARRYSQVWAKNTNRYKVGVEDKIKDLLNQIEAENEKEQLKYGDKQLEEYGEESSITSEDIRKKAEQINERLIKKQQNDRPTQDIKAATRQVKQLKKYANKLEKYEKQQAILDGRNSYSKTDPDATFMRMKDDQLYAGYNIIQGTENQYIVNYTIHQTPGESHIFIPHMKQLERLSVKLPARVIGDSAYGSEENYNWINNNKVDNYLKYGSFHREQTNKIKQNPFLKDNFPYEPENDSFTCPQGKKLKYKFTASSRSKTGYKVQARHYESEGCQDCHVADLCKRSPGNRKIKVSPKFEQFKKQARHNLLSSLGKKLRKQRNTDVETSFGDIKHNQKFTRFHLRGLEKVNIEWGLVSIAHNIRKLAVQA